MERDHYMVTLAALLWQEQIFCAWTELELVSSWVTSWEKFKYPNKMVILLFVHLCWTALPFASVMSRLQLCWIRAFITSTHNTWVWPHNPIVSDGASCLITSSTLISLDIGFQGQECCWWNHAFTLLRCFWVIFFYGPSSHPSLEIIWFVPVTEIK